MDQNPIEKCRMQMSNVNTDRLEIEVPVGLKLELLRYADQEGVSLSGLLKAPLIDFLDHLYDRDLTNLALERERRT
jgi:hypothetical protein